MAEPTRAPKIALRDSTLREGLDTPGVRFSLEDRVEIARLLAECGVREAEVVAPSRVAQGLAVVEELRRRGVALRTSGLVYAAGAGCREEVAASARGVDRFDLLMPLSPKRAPHEPEEKARVLLEALAHAASCGADAGAGFPHATQADPSALFDLARRAVAAGATRVTLYDTNGSADPFAVRGLVAELAASAGVPVFFHAHNDLGLATANALAAALAGASGLDVTVNGLGDRAGNASLEQVVIALRLRGRETGADPARLRELSRLVAERSGVPVSKLAPVVGDFVFAHRSPGHLPALAEFEAFDPALVGVERRVER
ncbi:MAG TPA: homocitrate synthase [Candidatus Binatia bacterium]|nr:homocitrate synthase [Candidatus Binatia bacterium]